MPAWQNWIRVRHALKFTLRRKPTTAHSPPLSHIDRQIPTISVSLESDDEHLSENKQAKKTKKISTTNNDNGATGMPDETDLDDESIQFVRGYHRQRLDENEATQSSSFERHDLSSTNIQLTSSPIDDESSLTRKQSKIGRWIPIKDGGRTRLASSSRRVVKAY